MSSSSQPEVMSVAAMGSLQPSAVAIAATKGPKRYAEMLEKREEWEKIVKDLDIPGVNLHLDTSSVVLTGSLMNEFLELVDTEHAKYLSRWPADYEDAKTQHWFKKFFIDSKSYPKHRRAALVKLNEELLEIKQKAEMKVVRDINYRSQNDSAVEAIPEHGRWITFPLLNGDDANDTNGDAVPIQWNANGTTHTAMYYRTTCWFGTLMMDELPNVAQMEPERSNDGTKSEAVTVLGADGGNYTVRPRLVPFGETDLFIAAEFIADRYRGAPHLHGLHLKDSYPVGTKWAYRQLDHGFHYGQDNAKTYRYLVYHPFLRERQIPQVRTNRLRNIREIPSETRQRAFANNLMLQLATSVTANMAGSGNQYVATVGGVASAGTTLIGAITEQSLHRFGPLNSNQLLYAYSIVVQNQAPPVDDHLKSTLVDITNAKLLREDASNMLKRVSTYVSTIKESEEVITPQEIDQGIDELCESLVYPPLPSKQVHRNLQRIRSNGGAGVKTRQQQESTKGSTALPSIKTGKASGMNGSGITLGNKNDIRSKPRETIKNGQKGVLERLVGPTAKE